LPAWNRRTFLTTTPTNLGELLRRYQASPEARAAAPTSKVKRAQAFDITIRYFGGALTLAAIEKRDFRSKLYDWRDSYADRPHAANDYIKHLNTVLNWAVDRGYMRDNPAAGLKKLKTASRADIIWTPHHIKALREVAEPAVLQVFDIGRWTGLRLGDILALRAFQFEDGWLSVTPQKTVKLGIRLSLPYYLLPPLGDVVTQLLRIEWLPQTQVLRNLVGGPWLISNYEKKLNLAKAKAGLSGEDLHFHDLRGTLVTALLEAGCTEAETGSISGHGLAHGNMRSYAARTRPLAESAYRKLAAIGWGL